MVRCKKVRAMTVAWYPTAKYFSWVHHSKWDGAEEQARKVVLGIESSCDDTGVAVVTSDGQILAEVLVSQVPAPNWLILFSS